MDFMIYLDICFPACIQSLPRIADSLQRSDGEEEEDGSLSLSPLGNDSSPDNDLLDLEGLSLPLPLTFEQEGEDGVSVSLGDLVRHMHPYCMAICVENEEGEQMLPEGGILFEVVDQGENGEPILAIPNMDLPVSLPLIEQPSENEQKVSDEAEDVASDSSEHIVVDDEDVTVTEAPVKVAAPVTPDFFSDVNDEIIMKRQKDEIREKSPSRRKKKKKSKEQCQPKPVEGRVLRSGKVRNAAEQSSKKTEKRSVKEEKKHKLPKVPVASAPASSSVKPKKLTPSQTEAKKEITTTTLSPEMKVQVATSVSPRQEEAPLTAGCKSQPTAVSTQQPAEIPKQLASTPEKVEDSSAAPSTLLPPVSSESPAAAPGPVTPQATPPVSEPLPPVAPAVSEPKPKSLSLAEYRRLRQQKKLAPVEKQDSNNSTKWPSLPELPKELPPIPCLPDPCPKDPRRPIPQVAKKELEDVRPAWQPRGPCAPPTPEALLVPPAYMVASSSKVSAASPAPKPQQTSEPSKPSPPENPLAPAPSSMNLPPHQHISAVPCVPQSAGSAAPPTPNTQCISSSDRKCSPAVSGEKNKVDERPQSQPASPQSVELPKTCPKTTTEAVKPPAATLCAARAPQKVTVVLSKVPEVTAPTLLDNALTSDVKYSKPTDNDTRPAHHSDSKTLKVEPVVLETKEKPTTAVKPQKAKSPTQELIEAFTSEIGEL